MLVSDTLDTRKEVTMSKKNIPKLPSTGHRVWQQRGGLHDPRPNRERQRGQAKSKEIDRSIRGL